MLREIEKQTFSPKFPESICHMRLILRLADAGVMKRYFIENGRFTFEKLLAKHMYHRRFQQDAADTLQWLADPDKIMYSEVIDEHTVLFIVKEASIDGKSRRLAPNPYCLYKRAGLEDYLEVLLSKITDDAYELIFAPTMLGSSDCYIAGRAVRTKDWYCDNEYYEWKLSYKKDSKNRRLGALHGLNRLRHLVMKY